MDNKKYKFFLITFFVILALPLLAVLPWFHPAAWAKAIIFRIIISSLLFFLVWQIISGKIKLNLKFPKPFWLLVAFWLVFLLATIFSQNPYYSFWESPYRGAGFLNFSLYIVFAILAFLIIKKHDWKKIWDFCMIIGVLASIMAILQYFQIFKQHLIPYEGNPPATFGNSMFLAIYLLLLIFLALSFGLKEKRCLKKLFYFSIILLFLLVILITKTRAVYLGLIMGFIYFFLAYPKKILLLKIATIFALFLVICSIYFVNTQDQLPEFIENNRILKGITSRLSFKLILEETRFPAWKVALNGIKERPILGWGPENFSIAFDKYYDPALPGLSHTWWDRAHNFMLEIAVTAGIPALIIYLSLFTVLFWQLQKLKKKNPAHKLIYHSIQASFIGYLTANFFSFDSFSTYLISFLLIAYSLFLIKGAKLPAGSLAPFGSSNQLSSLWKYGVMLGLFCLLIAFIWFAGLKPLKVNKEINLANYYSKNNQCEKAVEKMDNILFSHTNIDSFVRFEYIDIIRDCLKQDIQRKNELVPKAVSVLKQAAEIRPYHTRTWILLANYLNVLIANSKDSKTLTKQAIACLEKAQELSPKREEILLSWIQTDLLSGNYQGAKLKAEECAISNPNLADCWWKKSLANIYLKEFEQADKNIEIAIEKGYNTISKKSLVQLSEAYMAIKNYERLADIYEKLIIHVDKENFQYHASLAYVYKILGEYEKAREQTLTVVTLSPGSIENAKGFLKSILDLDNNKFQYHLYLARAYYITQDFEQAEKQGLIAWQYSIPKKYSRAQADEFLRNLYFHLAKLHYEKREYKQAKQKALKAWQYSQEFTQPRAKIDAFLESLPR